MNISKLFQRAHALRMEDKAFCGREVSAEFYVGQAIGECVAIMKNTRGEFLLHSEVLVYISWTVHALRCLAHKPEALAKVLLHRSIWPKDMLALWERLLRTYGAKPRLLLAIADGMEV